MRKIFLILFIFLFWTPLPLFSMDDYEYMSVEEYQKFFEMGLSDDTPDEEEAFKPKLKEKIEETEDTIRISDDKVKLKIEKNAFLLPYKEIFKEDTAEAIFYKNSKLNVYTNSTNELSDYMTTNLKATMNASYAINNFITVQAGHETWYVNPDASLGSRKFYFNPRLNLTDKFYLDYISRYNQTTKNVEQEIGVNYKPKLFKDSASFGIKATTVINEDRQVQSQRLKFSTDFYLF